MTNIVPFTFESHSVRVIERDGEPWFIASDVCAVLDIINNRDAISRLDDDEKGVAIADTPGGEQSTTIINESGLYSLVLTSRKPQAKVFKKWITSDVIPSIRKTGGYGVPAEAMNDPIIKMRLEQIEMDKRITKLESMLPAPTTHMTVLGYASAHGVSIDVKRANALGRRAAALTNMRGLVIAPVPDDRYGTVNSYPLSVLEEVFG